MVSRKHKKNKLPKIMYEKLGRHKAIGLCYKDPAHPWIFLDPRIRGKQHLEVLIHELLHAEFPELSETMVTRKAYRLRDMLWSEKYRRIDE